MRVSFELEWIDVPRSERVAPILARALVRRVNGRALRRLEGRLEG